MLSDFNLKCKQIYKLASLQKNRIVNAAIASAIETQKPALTYLEAAGSWVYEHPIATIAVVSGIVILGGVGYTYVFYPHLLGYISAAGGLTTKQLLDEELKKNIILQDTLAKATSQLAETEGSLIAERATNSLLQSALSEKSSEVLSEQGLRFASEAANAVLQSTLSDKAAEVVAEQSLRVAAEATVSLLQTSLSEKSAEFIAEQGLRVAAQATKDFLQVKSPAGERLFLEGLTRVLAERPEQLVVKTGDIRMSPDRANLIMSYLTETIQLTLNLLTRKPISTPIPPDMNAKVGGTVQSCFEFIIQTFFG